VLRDYQLGALNKAKDWLKVCIEPSVMELATGAGKSHIVASLAEWLNNVSGGKKVLCLAPSKELIEQNREKYLLTGKPASIFSGSVGKKCLKHDVVFATEKTVLNHLDKFCGKFCAVIIDECHCITPTIKEIVTPS
jgi:DNA repair protein RadD